MNGFTYDLPKIGTAEDGFWVLCTTDGKVTLCSSDALKSGVAVGSVASDLIADDQMPEFEDAMNISENGGDVSLLMDASPSTGYSLAHLSSGILFGAPAVRIYFYKDKNEYLADSIRRNDSVGRVFGYKGNYRRADASVDPISANAEDVSGIPGFGFVRFDPVAMELLSEIDRVEADARGDDDSELTDVSAVFEIIKKIFENSGRKPFDVRFVSDCKGSHVISSISQGRFTGLVLLSAAVTTRLSDGRGCSVSLRADGDSASIVSKCTLHRGYSMYCRSSEFPWLHMSLGANSTELMMLEYLISLPGHNGEFRCDRNGEFVLSVEITTPVDPDRLKFRDSTLGVDAVARRYMDQFRHSFSSDTKE